VSEFEAALIAHGTTPNVLIVHSTTPGMFVGGTDLADVRERRADDGLAARFAGVLDRLDAHRWPTIALIDGPALGGGCELALACDFRLASPRASFGHPENGLGILAGAGANWRLREVVGLALTRRMLFAGERVSADRALQAGLVDGLSPENELLEAGLALAERIAQQSWRALELTKMALAVNRPSTAAFDRAAQALLYEGRDMHERVSAFLERRSAPPDAGA